MGGTEFVKLAVKKIGQVGANRGNEGTWLKHIFSSRRLASLLQDFEYSRLRLINRFFRNFFFHFHTTVQSARFFKTICKYKLYIIEKYSSLLIFIIIAEF